MSRQGFYAWQGRGQSERSKEDEGLGRRIRSLFEESEGTYGAPRIHASLQSEGTRVSRRRVQRLMRAAGLRGRVVRVYRSSPGLRGFFAQHPNRLWKLKPSRLDQVWVGDVTYLPVGQQWRYLAVVMDQYSRRVLGWSLSEGRGASLTRRALDIAVARRQPRRRLIFHSDRGIEYAADKFRDRLRALGVRQSMTRGGAPCDNAHMESFFHSLKADVVHGVRFRSERELRSCIARYVRYYNHKRSHSALGYRSPVEYESRIA